jgi:hypothetical protein
MLTTVLLRSYEGKSMRDICPHGYDNPGDNHCAHFVSHVLQLGFGMTCTRLRGVAGAMGAANVRVQEVFAQCVNPAEVLACPTTGEGLVFVSAPTTFRGSPVTVRNVRNKHVGLVLNGIVWHYSNGRSRVVTQSVGDFLRHYPRQQNAIWWADFPITARSTPFGTSS